MHHNLLFVLVLCLLLPSLPAVLAQPAIPGFKATVLQSGLDYAVNVSIPILQAAIPSVTLPPTSGSTHVPVIGTIHYEISNMMINQFNLGGGYLAPVSGKGLLLKVSSLQAKISLKWHWARTKFPKASGSGTADVGVGNTNVQILVGIGSSGGQPTAQALDTQVSIGTFTVKVHGGASWIYNLLIGLFKGKIKSEAQKGISQAIAQAINNQLNAFLATIPLGIPIHNWAVANFSLTSAPTFESTYFTADALGALLPPNTPPPFLPTQDFPDKINAPSMLQLSVSDFALNMAGYTAAKQGKLNISLTNDNLPKSFPIAFTTTSFGLLIPALYLKYPGMNMSASIGPYTPPTGHFYASGIGGLAAKAMIEARFFVLPPNSSPVSVFTLLLDTNLAGEAFLNGNRIAGKVESFSLNTTLLSSSIGTFSPSLLDSAINTAINDFLIPVINSVIEVGGPLPLPPQISLPSASIVYGDGFVTVAASVSYTPKAVRSPWWSKPHVN